MDKSHLDKLIRLYREGYISRDDLIKHSKNAILKKDRSRTNARPQPNTTRPERPPVSAPIQAVIDLDSRPTIPVSVHAGSPLHLKGNPIVSSMFGGALIALAIVALVIFFFGLSDDQAQSNVVNASNGANTSDTSVTATEVQLKALAHKFEQESQWQEKDINRFRHIWNTLSDSRQESVKQTHWFKTYSLILAIQLTQVHSIATEKPNNKTLRREFAALSKLAMALGHNAPVFEELSSKKRKKIKISDIDLEPLNSTPAPLTKKKPKASIAPATATKPAQSAAESLLTAESRLPELEKLLSDYVGNYEKGNLDSMVKLFNGSGWHQGKIGDYELREHYKETFNQTQNRKMLIENLNWSFKGQDTALATGKLTLLYTDKDSRKAHEQHGSIRLVATLQDNHFRFSNLYHILP